VPRIAYAPYKADLSAPGDRRRFVAYAKSRGIDFEIARPREGYDLVVLSGHADFTYWAGYAHGKVVLDLVDSYLAEARNLKSALRGTVKFLCGTHRHLELSYRETLRRMCRRADAVICSTQEQKTDIARCSTNVHVILDIHSSVTRTRKTDYAAGTPFKIGWEGLTSNLRQLATIKDSLRAVAKTRAIELHIVTDPSMPRYFDKLGQVATQSIAGRLFERATVHVRAGDRSRLERRELRAHSHALRLGGYSNRPRRSVRCGKTGEQAPSAVEARTAGTCIRYARV
jgi:hypothetical protein